MARSAEKPASMRPLKQSLSISTGLAQRLLTLLSEVAPLCCHPEVAQWPKDPTGNPGATARSRSSSRATPTEIKLGVMTPAPGQARGVLRASGPQNDSERERTSGSSAK
jgi:hypothetical protein